MKRSESLLRLVISAIALYVCHQQAGRAATDAAVAVRIWAQGASGSSMTVWETTYGYTQLSTYQGPMLYSSGPTWLFTATYVGQTWYGQHVYYYSSSQLATAHLSLSGNFLDGAVSQSKTPTVPYQTVTVSLGSQGVVRVEPGKSYTLVMSYGAVGSGAVYVAAPPQYRVILNGMERNRCSLSTNVTLTVLSRNAAPPGAAGFSSGLRPDRIEWTMPLGTLRNGDDAGALRLVDLGTGSDWNTVFTPAGLQYEGASGEVFVYRQDNMIRQVFANQIAVDIVTVTANRYEIRCFNRFQMSGAQLPVTPMGQPFATYTVMKSDDAGDPATALKLIREFRNVTNSTGTANDFPITRTEGAKIVRTGTWPNFTWTKSDWHTGTAAVQETVTTVGSTLNEAGQLLSRTEDIQLRTPGVPNSVALRVTRGFTTLPFGEAFTSEIQGSTNSRHTQFAYHQDLNQPGSLGFVESVSTNSGTWEAYDYYDSNQANSYLGGRLKYKYRPHGPDGSQSPVRNVSTGEVTYYEYSADPFGSMSRPSLVQTTVNGIVVAKKTIAYNSTALEGVITATTTEYAAASVPVVSTSSFYSEGSSDSFIRGKPVTNRRPDGVTESYAYEIGIWDGSQFVQDEESPNATCTTVTVTADNAVLVDGVSECRKTIRDSWALVVRTETYTWVSGEWRLVDWTNFSYNFRGQLVTKTASNGGTLSADWDGPLKISETDQAGGLTNYTSFDAAGRVLTATRAGASLGGSSIAAITTTYTYDAANRVTQTTVGPTGGENLATANTFDDAGRPTGQMQPGLGWTQFTYDVPNRKRTTTRPDTSTIIEVTNIDGTLARRAGSAMVEQYFSHGVESDGRRWTRTDIGAKNSLRWVKSWTDWLGRTTVTRRPGFSGQADLEEVNWYDSSSYNNTGRLLKKTTPGSAATLFSYNGMSQIVQTGLDIDNGGTLVNASTDRITSLSDRVELISGDFWRTKSESKYPYSGGNAGTAVQMAKESRRLTDRKSVV